MSDRTRNQSFLAGTIVVEAGKRKMSRTEALSVLDEFVEVMRNMTDEQWERITSEAVEEIRGYERHDDIRAAAVLAILTQPEPKERPWWKLW